MMLKLATTDCTGFEALVFQRPHVDRGHYRLIYIRKDGSRFPGAVVSVTRLARMRTHVHHRLSADSTIILQRKQVEEIRMKLDQTIAR